MGIGSDGDKAMKSLRKEERQATLGRSVNKLIEEIQDMRRSPARMVLEEENAQLIKALKETIDVIDSLRFRLSASFLTDREAVAASMANTVESITAKLRSILVQRDRRQSGVSTPLVGTREYDKS